MDAKRDAKSEWIKNIILILIGINFSTILSAQTQVHDFLYWLLKQAHIPQSWGTPMGIIILLGVLIALCIWFWRLTKQSKSQDDANTQKLINDTVRATIKALKDEGILK